MECLRRILLLVGLSVGVLASLAGCGGSNSSTPNGGSGSGGIAGFSGGGAGGSSGAGGLSGAGGDTAPAGTGGGTIVSGAGGDTGPSGTGGGTAPAGTGGDAGLSGTGGSSGTGGTGGTSVPTGDDLPCDIYQKASTPCVGAYSTVRALYKGYTGNLYQVRGAGGTKDIPVGPDGFADSSQQDAFCTGACTLATIYDQSDKHNDLILTKEVFWLKYEGTTLKPVEGYMRETDIKAVKINVGGHPVYGVKFFGGQGNGYRVMHGNGTAVGEEAEAMYAVFDSTVYNAQCCNDFGNAETDGQPGTPATMEAIYYGNDTLFGQGGGNGPWLMADFEVNIFTSNVNNDPSKPSLNIPAYATLMLKGFASDRFDRFALKYGDAQTGPLTTQYDGVRPDGEFKHLKKEGSIILGTGGDGSFYSTGIFFEGAITFGCPDDNAVDDAIQASIVAAGYGR
jgi:non-reducing end alpha-L-arabinofuranosidase